MHGAHTVNVLFSFLVCYCDQKQIAEENGLFQSIIPDHSPSLRKAKVGPSRLASAPLTKELTHSQRVLAETMEDTPG